VTKIESERKTKEEISKRKRELPDLMLKPSPVAPDMM
jgi:hypothetical protein